MALDKYNPNKPQNPMDLLHNYDKPGMMVTPTVGNIPAYH